MPKFTIKETKVFNYVEYEAGKVHDVSDDVWALISVSFPALIEVVKDEPKKTTRKRRATKTKK